MVAFDQVDKTNYTALKFCEQNKGKVEEICTPLLECFGIEYFSYFKFLSNGYGISISNQLHVNQSYFDYLNKNGLIHTEEFNKPSLERQHYFLWPRSLPPTGYDFPYNYAINIQKRDTEHYEGFTFAAKKANGNLQSLFIDNLFLLEKFGEYFKMQARDLIELDDPQKLVFAHNIDFDKHDTSKSLNQIQQFLEEIKPTRLMICDRRGQEVLLNEEETSWMIAFYVSQHQDKGLVPSLEIADSIIKQHIRKIKHKTGHHRVNDLIQAIDEKFKQWFKFYVLCLREREKGGS